MPLTPCERLPALADLYREAGAALQRHATDLAEGHESTTSPAAPPWGKALAKGTGVVGPWGTAGAQED